MTIAAIIARTIAAEGGYVNHPSDKGGETNFGITIATARRNGFKGPMRELTKTQAIDIYSREFFITPGFDRIEAISPKVAEELFDTGVNMGPSVPARWFQEWLNALNSQGRDYPDIGEDADIGPSTIAAFKAFRAKRGAVAADTIMLKGLNCSQGERYKELARGRVKNEDFVFGWLANRVGL